VHTSFESLEGMQPEWDQFVESVGGEIFLTYDWCRIWWKYYGKNRDLRVFIFRDNKMLIGIIPIFFEKTWLGPIAVKAVKIVGSDFTLTQFSLPLADGYVRPVVKKFHELVSKHNFDIIHIGPIAGLDSHCDELKNSLKEFLGNSYSVLIENKTVQTYFLLADTLDEQLAGLKKGERWDIKRSYKALCPDATLLFVNVASKNSFEYIFQSFVNMHQSYWERLGNLGHFGDWPESHEFHCEMANNQLRYDRLRLFEIKCGAQSLGYEYNYKFGKRYFEFLNARTDMQQLAKISVGKVVFCEEVKKALEEGVKCIDSMRGKYEHKLRLGGKLFPIRNIYIIPRKLPTMIRVFIFRIFALFLDLFYYKIWYCRLAPKLPFRRRPLWKVWICSRL
jgi:CelD/BcsL family acetyltransferase involved in cellulose biosynthesis